MTVETILLVLAVSASGRVSGELEEKRITFRDPEHGAVERLYLQLLPASYGDPGPDNLVPLVLDFHGYMIVSRAQEAYKGEIQCPILPNQICF